MGENKTPSNQFSDEIERREEAPAPELIPRSPVITRSACSSRTDMKRPSIGDDIDGKAPKIRKAWPNASEQARWFHYERFTGRSKDPQAAIEKLWRKREKRLRRAQIESNKVAAVNLAKD